MCLVRPRPRTTMSTISRVGKTKKFEQNRERLLVGAALLFNEHGVKGATLADVADFAGLSLKSIRYYFQRKEDLIAESFQRAIAVYSQLADTAAKATNPRDRVRVLLEEFMRLSMRIRRGEHPPFLHFGDIRAVEGIETSPLGASYNMMFRRFRGLLGSVSRSLEERQRLNARTHLLLSQLLWAVVWIWRYEDDQFARVAAHMHRIFCGGLLGSPKAWQPVELPGDEPAQLIDAPSEAFLRAATTLINEQGYRGASVDRIAARLSVTKGAFYHHHEAKDDLVVACFQRTFDVMRAAQLNALVEPLANRQLSSVAAHLAHYQLGPQGPLLRTSALTAVPPSIRLQMTRNMDGISSRFNDMLTDGVVQGSVAPLDTWIGAQMMTGMLNSIAELPLWVPSADGALAVDAYARPMFTGLFDSQSA